MFEKESGGAARKLVLAPWHVHPNQWDFAWAATDMEKP